MKPFTTLAVVVFTLAAILHLLRILNEWDVAIAGTVIPMWASYLGLLIAVLLAAMVRRESGHGSEGRSRFWEHLNKPLVVLMAAAGLAVVLLYTVWEPYQIRRQANTNQEAFRQEAAYRLHHIDLKIGTDGSPEDDVHGGGRAVSLNPEYRTWSLAGLINEGWGYEKLHAVQQYFDDFKRLREKPKPDPGTIMDPKLVIKARQSVKKIKDELDFKASFPELKPESDK